MPALWEIHRDPKHFPEPKEFKPERFLDSGGKFVENPAMVAFGVGKRECLGKVLAKQETFLFMACLLHQFRFMPSNEGTMPSLEGILAATYVTKPFKFRVERRLLQMEHVGRMCA